MMQPLTPLAEQAFSRAAGARLVEGNRVRLLEDARENYPAWLEAIASARDHVHFESYIIYDDDAGKTFADALIDRARHGARPFSGSPSPASPTHSPATTPTRPSTAIVLR
jgi:cardiolipin synthase